MSLSYLIGSGKIVIPHCGEGIAHLSVLTADEMHRG